MTHNKHATANTRVELRLMILLTTFATSALVPSPPALAQFCGDGNVDPGEQCDDNNTDSCDGCDLYCQDEPTSPCPWPDGVVYFDFDDSVTGGGGAGSETEYMRRAMDTWSQTDADVAFLPRNGLAGVPYVIISNDTGGNSVNIPGAPAPGNFHTMNINNTGMGNIWFPVHELGHVLGFEHEMKHPNRNTFLTIHDANINDSDEGQYSPTVSDMMYDTNTFDFSYDSIMLYPECFDSICDDCPNDNSCTAGGVNMTAADASQQSRMGFGAFSENNEELYSVDIDRAESIYGTGKVRYVNQASNDPSNGTLEEPYTSFSDAKTNAPDGARVYIAGGTYDIANTQTKHMRLQAYPNDPVTLH